jgi:hypothetical protein
MDSAQLLSIEIQSLVLTICDSIHRLSEVYPLITTISQFPSSDIRLYTISRPI